MPFLDHLTQKYQSLIEASITHPLTNELCAGTLPDYKLYVYLVQDLKFFQKGMNVFGKTLAYCDDAKSAITLAKQIGFVANDENDYFTKCLDLIEPKSKSKIPRFATNKDTFTLPKVNEYLELLDYLTFESTSYVEIITFMYVMEFVYLGWANYNLNLGLVDEENLDYKYKEWVVLHSGPDFTKWVKFLENEVERVTLHGDDNTLELCENTFKKALQLEIDFFEECYKYEE